MGDTSRIDEALLISLDIVETVKRISEPFKSANRKFHPDNTVVNAGDTMLRGGAGIANARSNHFAANYTSECLWVQNFSWIFTI